MSLSQKKTKKQYIYIYIYIYTQRKSAVELTIVGLAHARPNYMKHSNRGVVEQVIH